MIRLFLLLAVVCICLAQTPAPPVPISAISAWYLLPGQSTSDPLITSTPQYKWAHLNAPLTGYLDATNTLQLGITPAPGPPGGTGIAVEVGCSTAAGCVTLGTATTLDIEPGIGVLCVPQVNQTSGVMTLQCSSDTAVMALRVAPPAASGNCVNPITGNALPLGTWGAGPDPVTGVPYFYTCVQPPGIVLPLPTGVPLIFVWARVALVTGW